MFRINFLWGISLTVFNSHHSTFKAKKRIKLTYSSAKVLRVLNEKTRSSRSGFEKNLPCAINGTRYFLIKYRLTDWERCSNTVLFPVPYQSALSIISSNNQSKELSIQKLEKYLKKEWYRGHSDCAWHDDHKYGIRHDGYWSFESGALVKILGLDDSSLKGLPYYPYDMVHWNENKI